MQNEHGYRMVMQPSDMRLLVYLAKRCIDARRAWRRARKTPDLPMEIVTLYEGHWREAWNSFQGAKALVEVRWVAPPTRALETHPLRYGTLPSRTPRQLVDQLVGQPASDRLREWLVSIGNNVRYDARAEHRDLTDDEKSLLSEIRQYVRQIESLIPHLTRSTGPDDWFSSELIAKTTSFQLQTELVTPIHFTHAHPFDDE